MDKPWDDVGQVEATIESVLELCQISLSILGSNRMVSTAQRALDIGKNRVHPTELWMLYARTSTADHHFPMSTARHRDAMKAGQSIGVRPGAGAQVLLRPARQIWGRQACIQPLQVVFSPASRRAHVQTTLSHASRTGRPGTSRCIGAMARWRTSLHVMQSFPSVSHRCTASHVPAAAVAASDSPVGPLFALTTISVKSHPIPL